LSCSLGLDESLIGKGINDGGTNLVDATGADADDGGGGGGDDGTLPDIDPVGGTCATDEECKGTAGCLKAKCDLSRHACVLDSCRSACASAACDVAAKTCGTAAPYHYKVAQFPVGAAIGCKGVGRRCFTAIYPFVFVGTANGALAFAAHDPQSASPATVPLTGLTFVPTQIVGSGNRVFFVGTPVGTGAVSRIQIAYADVPQDPFATEIEVKTFLATYGRPATAPVNLIARGGDTALLANGPFDGGLAGAAIVEPPLADPVTIAVKDVSMPLGAAIVAVSGSRAILGRAVDAGPELFVLEGAGTGAQGNLGPAVPLKSGTPSGGGYYGQSADGAVFWQQLSMTAAAPMVPAKLRAAKAFFLFAGNEAPLGTPAGLDVEIFNVEAGTPMVGPVALLDANNALVTTAVLGDTKQSNVSFVTRTPFAVVKNADGKPRRFPIPLPVAQLSPAGSNGIGYVLAVDPAAPNVYVFDPACAP
jgi:hypothetical protein